MIRVTSVEAKPRHDCPCRSSDHERAIRLRPNLSFGDSAPPELCNITACESFVSIRLNTPGVGPGWRDDDANGKLLIPGRVKTFAISEVGSGLIDCGASGSPY